MTNNLKGTMTLTQIGTAARDIIAHYWEGYPTPTPDQIRFVVDKYCDNPSINATDKARIRVRIEQLLR